MFKILSCGKKTSYSAQRGVAAIDIAIVTITIGLLFMTIIASNTLVQNANINLMMSQIYKYKATYKIFKIRYYAIPGDMDNASKVIQGVGPSQNGNGDGKINFEENNYGETLLPWVHMAKAGFIDDESEVSYSGNPCCNKGNWGISSSSEPNVAKPNISEHISNITKNTVPVYMFFYSTGTSEGNKLALSGSAKDNNRPFHAPIAPAEQHKIDIKYDDGLPLSGTIVSDAGLIAGTNISVRNNPVDTCINGEVYLETPKKPGVDGCILVLKLDD